MEGSGVVCAVMMSGIALEQMGGLQLNYINLVPLHISGPSPAVGLLVHVMDTSSHHTLFHACCMWCPPSESNVLMEACKWCCHGNAYVQVKN